MDKYKIDSHKLIYHVDRVNDWLKGNSIYPIYVEISPAGGCNHRCTYCGLDFMGYQPRFLDTALLKKRLLELGKLGIKSVMYAGEGEPFLHKDIIKVIRHTKKVGIDMSVTTNGVFFNKEIADNVLQDTAWIKVSVDAARRDTYARIHRTNQDDFDRVIENISYAVEVKRKNNHMCVLGMQMLLLPENRDEAISLAELAREIGVDYLVIKPYSQHPQSKTKIYKSVKYDNCEDLKIELEKLNKDGFRVIFRISAMKRWNEKKRNYNCCFALPFWSHIDAAGDVWACSVYLDDERFYYGNIYNNCFQEIWEGMKRRESLDWVENELNTSKCRINCRMDAANRYLWDLKNLPEHVNFI